MKRVKYLGIDFGSSTTTVVGFLEGETDKPILFGDAQSNYKFESVIWKAGNENFFFENAYIEMKSSKNNEELVFQGLCDALKESLIQANSNSEAVENVATFLRELARRISTEEYDFSKIERVVFGHPAYYAAKGIGNYCNRMKKILSQILKEELNVSENQATIDGVPEPLLSAYAYDYINVGSFKSGDQILVLDFGGHTLDIALMEAVQTVEGVRLIDKNCGSFNESVEMGKQITKNLCQRVYRGREIKGEEVPFDWGVDDAKCELFKDLNSCIQRSAQFFDYDDDGKKTSKNYCLKYKADRSEEGIVSFVGRGKGKIYIEEKFSKIEEIIRAYLKGGLEPSVKINYLLFTGGTAKMKPLRDYICVSLSDYWAEGFKILLMDDEAQKKILRDYKRDSITVALSSDNAVALGAALVAAGRCRPLSKVKAKEETTLENEKKKNQRLELKNKDLERKLFLERCKSKGLSNEMLMKAIDEQKDIWLKAIDLLGKDKKIWENLTSNEKEFLKKILNKTIDLD